MINPNIEYRNPKQIQNSNFQMTKTFNFEHLNFGNSVLFRNSNFGFQILKILCLLFAFLTFAYAEEVTKIIAKVNNEIITSQDLDDYCKALSYRFSGKEDILAPNDKEFRKMALQRLIEDALILTEAKKEKIKIPSSFIDEKLNQFILSYPSREEFEKALIERGLTVTRLKERIRDQYLMREITQKYVKSFISISPQEISSYYTENQDKLLSPARYIFYIAKSEDLFLLQNILNVIKEKGILVAQKEYQDILKRVESGRAELKEELTKIIEKLEEKKANIEKINNFYYLVYLQKTIAPRPLTLEEAKQKIYSYLWQKKFQQRFNQWIDKLREQAVIKIYYE